MSGGSWLKPILSTLALTFAAAAAGAAAGQSPPPPPEHYTRDARGVDLVTGRFTYATIEVAIGAGVGAMVHARVQVQGIWYDIGVGRALCDTSGCAVVVHGQTEYFTGSGTYAPTQNTGSTLTYDANTGVYSYRRADGTTYAFNQYIYDPTQEGAQLTRRIDPNGLVTDYSYLTQAWCVDRDEWGECIGYLNFSRLQSYGNTAGYRLHYQYVSDDVNLDRDGFFAVAKVTGFNAAVDYCAPTAPSCTFSRTWPSATYSRESLGGLDFAEVVTDELGRETRYVSRYGGPGERTYSIRLPGSTIDDVEVFFPAPDYAYTVTDATGLWTYERDIVGGDFQIAVTGPEGQELKVLSDTSIGRAIKVTDALDQEWTYAYSGGRLSEATAPEGNKVQYTYDARGNVTQARQVDKSGTQDIVTSATYATSCVGNVACNSPLTTIDPLGRVTEYDWDEDHGGLLSVTEPAPASGQPRPQTRYAYAAQTAWYKNSSGTIVAAPSSVTLPVQISACATGSTCAGTADEVRTSVTYGASGVANNLLVTQTAGGSGAVPNMAVTSLTHTPNGDVQTVDGPLPSSDDLTLYRYDDGRRMIGAVGPDPDGAGPRLNRAQRITYDARGQVSLAEQGTTPGYTDTDWANFVALQKAAQGYDAWGRPIRSELQGANGTVHALAQTSYDVAGRPECLAVRMNPAVFATVTADACVRGTQAGFGPDRIVRTTYDVLGRPSSTTAAPGLPEAITESVTYTDNGLPRTLTDGEGNVSILEYDGFDRPSRLRYPNPTGGGTSTTDFDAWTYDEASNVLTESRRGTTLTYAYDALDRLIQATAPSTPVRGYGYDLLGRLTTAHNDEELWQTFTYDALGRTVSERWFVWGVMDYAYDAAGRRTRITWPSSGPGAWFVDYDWDVYDGLTAVRENGAVSGPGVLATYAYDDLGRRTSATLGNGATTTWAYDAVSRLSGLTFDPAGTADDLTITYVHDPAGGIVQRTLSDGDYGWAPVTGSTSYQNDGLNRVTSAGGTAVTYDGGQNAVTAPGTPTLTFDGLNRLKTGGGISLGYEPMGRVYSFYGGPAEVTTMIYAGDQLAAEYDHDQALLLRRHVPGAGLDDVVATVAADGTRTWLSADERGSVMALTNASGAVTQINAWDEYGVPRPGNAGTFQYAGQMWLGFANLQHSRARAYDPTLGRFRQTDPIGYAAGANLYAYVGADPVNFVDPWGLMQDPVRGISGAQCFYRGGFPTNQLSSTPPLYICAPRPSFDGVMAWGRGVGGSARVGGSAYDGAFGGCLASGDCGGPGVMGTAEQVAFKAVVAGISKQNAWMAEPVLLVMPSAWFARFGTAGRIAGRLCNCFVEDTLVHTADGLKPIQDIQVGDLVLSRDEATGQTAYKPVTALLAGSERQIWEVSVETVDAVGASRTETFGTTDEHPWRLVGGEWRETAELEPGDRLVTADGREASVTAIARTDRLERTYNFEVEGYHTYFVGEVGAWVHNVCRGVYEFVANSGRIYVGQSANVAVRLRFHRWTGRLPVESSVSFTPVAGGRTARRIAEQTRMNELGGVRRLDNRINAIAENHWARYGIPVP